MHKWTKSEVRRLIVESLSPVIAPAGFRYRKSAEGFVRKIVGGRQEIGIVLWDFASLFKFTLTLCVRLDQVQDRVLPFFAEYTDIPSLNRGLNPAGAEHVTQEVWPPDRGAFDSSNMPYRAMAGLAVAHFAGDPRLIALGAAYRAQVSGMQDQERQKLESLAAFLLGTNDAEHDTAPITELRRPVR